MHKGPIRVDPMAKQAGRTAFARPGPSPNDDPVVRALTTNSN